MSELKLDQIVKGAPPPNVSPTQVAQAAKSTAPPSNTTSPVPPPQLQTQLHHHPHHHHHGHSHSTSTAPSDPRDTLPDSDAQKYLNLLILESSLRAQYVSLRARQHIYDLMLGALVAWTTTFTYLLFFRPREDGIGVGGSVYWVVETGEKLFWCSGIVTLCLFWATGTYERGVRWPRKFIGTTNRGLRGFNMKVVVVRGNLWAEMAGWLVSVFDPFGWLSEKRINFQVVPKDIEAGANKEHWNHHAARHGLIEEDVAPGGDVIKLLILPKPFSPDFREGWETYRMEFWDKENARRGELRKVVKARIREVARREGGWLWWMGWRGWKNVRIFRGKSRRQIEMEKLALREMKEKRRRESVLRDGSHSRSSSRSSSLTPEGDARLPKRAGEERVRRGSSSARRSKKVGAPASSRLSATETVFEDGDHALQPLSKKSSLTPPLGSDGFKQEDSRASTPDIKEEPAEA